MVPQLAPLRGMTPGLPRPYNIRPATQPHRLSPRRPTGGVPHIAGAISPDAAAPREGLGVYDVGHRADLAGDQATQTPGPVRAITKTPAQIGADADYATDSH